MDKLKLCHISLALYPDRRDGASKFVRGIYDELKTRVMRLPFSQQNGVQALKIRMRYY